MCPCSLMQWIIYISKNKPHVKARYIAIVWTGIWEIQDDANEGSTTCLIIFLLIASSFLQI